MTKRRYFLLDVFTGTMFGGNPLAVFPDAAGMDAALMQRIAGELGLSETVFVAAADRPEIDYRLRIFTPRMELPFAGHPTIGTAVLLAGLDEHHSRSERVVLRLEEQAGIVQVTVAQRETGRYAEFQAPQTPALGPTPPSSIALSRLLALSESDLAAAPDAPCAVSAGVPFLVIPVADADALAKATVDLSHWRDLLSRWSAPHMFVLAHERDRVIRARMFAPAMGIAEDPATGGAVAALPPYLARRFGLSDGSYEWTVNQGVEMGRPSRIDLRFDIEHGSPVRVSIGGGAVTVGEGTLFQ